MQGQLNRREAANILGVTYSHTVRSQHGSRVKRAMKPIILHVPKVRFTYEGPN